MEACPHCGRDNFSSKSGYTLHIKSCKGAVNKTGREKPQRRYKKNTATIKNYKQFRNALVKIAENMIDSAENFKKIAELADSVGHDGFAQFCRYFADKRIRDHVRSILDYADNYSDEAFKESRRPKPWE